MENALRSENILSFSPTPPAKHSNRESGPVPELNIQKKRQEELGVTEDLLRHVYENVKDVIFLIGRDGVILSINPAFERKTGWTIEEWVGKDFHPILHPDDVRLAWVSFKNSIRSQSPVNTELRVRGRDGKYLTGEFTWSPAFKDGKIVSVMGTVRDITERKRAEEKLQRERTLLQTLIDNLPDFIYFKDPEGHYVLNNRAHLNSLGLQDQEEALGKTTFDFNPPEYAAQYFKDEMEIVRTGDPLLLKEEIAIHKDKKDQRYHLTSKLPLKDGHGVVEGIIGISRDVTEWKRAEDALRESELKYRNMFANSIQPMFQSSVEGKLLNANRALMILLGYDSLHELSEINVKDLYVNRDQRNEIRQVLETKGYLSNVELQLKRKDGNVITVIEYSRALRDEHGQIVGFEGILEDITVRKAMERKLNEYVAALECSQKKLAQLNAEKDKLFSVLSHDLRSPFGSILGFCDILLTERSQLTTEEVNQFLSFIKEGAQDQLDFVNRLLDWSRLESGRIKMEMKEVNLGNIAEKSIHSLLGLSKKNEVVIDSQLPVDLLVRGDEEMLQNVFTNIIGNALKFTAKGGSIVLQLGSQTKSEITVAIADNGVGIPEADLHKLFHVEEKYTRKGLSGEKGTGLGLPVCSEIMQKHGGSIRVESKENNGTTFFLKFPTLKTDVGPNILIVDDEDGSRVLHARHVKRFLPNAHILYASNGKEGFECASKYLPNAIVTDYAMPVTNGFEMLTQLKENAATQHIPVLVVTGEDSKASHEGMTLTGAAEVFLKPVIPDALGAALMKAVESF